MNKILLAMGAIIPLMLVPAAQAQKYKKPDKHADYSYAEVIEVEPLIRYVRVDVPRRECWEEEVYYESRRSQRSHRNTAGATIAGGLIGGVIGRQIGGGSGRDAMTVAGAIVGSAVASNQARRNERDYEQDDGETRVVERCRTRHESREEERIDGYRVTYVYDGREYTTRTTKDPGDKIKVRVAVTPLGY